MVVGADSSQRSPDLRTGNAEVWIQFVNEPTLRGVNHVAQLIAIEFVEDRRLLIGGYSLIRLARNGMWEIQDLRLSLTWLFETFV